MARSRHSVAWRQMSQAGQSHRQQRRPTQPHRSHRRLMSGTDGRLPGSQQHRDEHSDHQHRPHPLTVAHRQSSGWQKRQANSTAAQRSRKEREREHRGSVPCAVTYFTVLKDAHALDDVTRSTLRYCTSPCFVQSDTIASLSLQLFAQLLKLHSGFQLLRRATFLIHPFVLFYALQHF